MNEKRFTIESERINTTYSVRILKDDEVIFEISNWNSLGEMHKTECEDIVNVLNKQQDTIITLKRRLEKINGGYGHLTHRNGLTANEWVIESQERELKKKNEQISDWIERHSKDIVRIGEQRATIRQLKEENEHLRQMIKENVFQRYNEGSLADLEFKAIAYNDIVKVEMSNESEPKVIVYCKQGKKENVKSFCQMFIPFGMPYEIKEIE